MNNGRQCILKRTTPESDSALAKYNSLLHILNGEEEFILDSDGNIIGSNLEAVNVTGYEEYEVIGKHISIFYRLDELSKAKSDLEKALRLGSAVVTGLRLKKRGVNFWAKMKIKYLNPTELEGPTFKVILQDATHRALSKERMRTLRDEYLSIFNNPFVGTFKFKTDGYNILLCNQKTLDILGAQQSNDLRLDRFFSSLGQFELFISSLRKEKKLEGFKFLVHDGKGQSENWAVISARLFEANGFAEGILLDISEQYSQMMELQRVNTELDGFIYHASHDLRSPLTSILGLVNLGLKESSNAESYLKMIQNRVEHLDLLLKDLISVSYNNGVKPERLPFQFEAEVKSMLSVLSDPMQKVKVAIDIAQPFDFMTDAVRMRIILRNLLSNALKYYNPEIQSPSIHLRVRAGRSHCAILLKDNGIGIHQKFKNKVFDMFFRATDRSAGSGLGLYIVKSMVEKLNGRISFESTLNVGTTFLVTIPNQSYQASQNQITSSTINHYMLTSRQIELVENSWDYVLLNSHETGNIFYEKLFSLDPQLREMFKGDIITQSQKLVSMITFAVHKLNSLEDIIADVKALGVQHKHNLVEVRHYDTVALALLWTLERALGPEWSEEVKDAWASVYHVLSKTMIDAAEVES